MRKRRANNWRKEYEKCSLHWAYMMPMELKTKGMITTDSDRLSVKNYLNPKKKRFFKKREEKTTKNHDWNGKVVFIVTFHDFSK